MSSKDVKAAMYKDSYLFLKGQKEVIEQAANNSPLTDNLSLSLMLSVFPPVLYIHYGYPDERRPTLDELSTACTHLMDITSMCNLSHLNIERDKDNVNAICYIVKPQYNHFSTPNPV